MLPTHRPRHEYQLLLLVLLAGCRSEQVAFRAPPGSVAVAFHQSHHSGVPPRVREEVASVAAKPGWLLNEPTYRRHGVRLRSRPVAAHAGRIQPTPRSPRLRFSTSLVDFAKDSTKRKSRFTLYEPKPTNFKVSGLVYLGVGVSAIVGSRLWLQAAKAGGVIGADLFGVAILSGFLLAIGILMAITGLACLAIYDYRRKK